MNRSRSVSPKQAAQPLQYSDLNNIQNQRQRLGYSTSLPGNTIKSKLTSQISPGWETNTCVKPLKGLFQVLSHFFNVSLHNGISKLK